MSRSSCLDLETRCSPELFLPIHWSHCCRTQGWMICPADIYWVPSNKVKYILLRILSSYIIVARHFLYDDEFYKPVPLTGWLQPNSRMPSRATMGQPLDATKLLHLEDGLGYTQYYFQSRIMYADIDRRKRELSTKLGKVRPPCYWYWSFPRVNQG